MLKYRYTQLYIVDIIIFAGIVVIHFVVGINSVVDNICRLPLDLFTETVSTFNPNFSIYPHSISSKNLSKCAVLGINYLEEQFKKYMKM